MFFVPSVHDVHILQWGVIIENSSVDIDIFIQYLLKAKIIEPVHEQQCGMCDQQSLRSACAYAQSDQSLC